MLHKMRTSLFASVAIASIIAVAGLTISSEATAQIRPPLGAPSGGGGAPTAPSGGGSAQPGGLLGGGPGGAAPQRPRGGADFLSQTEMDLDAQAGGMYPEMDRSSTMPVGAIQDQWNKPRAASGQTAPGIMRYVWRPDFVMAVRSREFMTTTIELPAWERIERIILGDTMVFEATRVKQNVLVIRPTHAGADTNMTVLGVSGNIYNFYLRSEGWNSNQITDLTVYVSATRARAGISESVVNTSSKATASPFDSNISMPASAPGNVPDYIRSIAFNPEDLRFDLRIYAPTPKDIEIAPLRAFTDGIWTYFDYGEVADTVRRPVVFQVIDGVDTMVNTRTAGPKGNILIAEAVGTFTLRNGERVICVYQTGVPQAYTAREHFKEHMDDAYTVQLERGKEEQSYSASSVPTQLRIGN